MDGYSHRPIAYHNMQPTFHHQYATRYQCEAMRAELRDLKAKIEVRDLLDAEKQEYIDARIEANNKEIKELKLVIEEAKQALLELNNVHAIGDCMLDAYLADFANGDNFQDRGQVPGGPPPPPPSPASSCATPEKPRLYIPMTIEELQADEELGEFEYGISDMFVGTPHV